jgi:hypothetical protein
VTPTWKGPDGIEIPITVGGQTVELELPRRMSIRHAIVCSAARDRAREQTARLVVAAALLLCWSSIEHKDGLPAYRHDLLEYGDEAIDFLLRVGATMPEIIRAGNAAIGLVLKDEITIRQMEEARGNSSAPSVGHSSNNGGLNVGTGSPTGG